MPRPVLQILTLFQTSKCYFRHPFSQLASKIHTRFRPGGGHKTQHHYLHMHKTEIMSSFLRLKLPTKDFLKPFPIRMLPFLSYQERNLYTFGIETTNTLIHNRSSFVNHTRFQTKMGKIYTRFQTKTAQKPYPLVWGSTYLP